MKPYQILWKYIKPYRHYILFAIIFVALEAFIQIQIPFIIKYAIDSVIGINRPDMAAAVVKIITVIGSADFYRANFHYIALVVVAFKLLESLAAFLKSKTAANASTKLTKELQNRLYQHIQSLSYDYHVKVDTGELLQKCTSDVNTVKHFVETDIAIIGRVVLLFAMVLITMLRLNVVLTIISTWILPLSVYLSIKFFQNIYIIFEELDKREAELSTTVQENISGMRVVRAFGRQKLELEKFDVHSKAYGSQMRKLVMAFAIYWPKQEIIIFLQRIIGMTVGIYFTVNGQITLGTFIAFLALAEQLNWPVRIVGRLLSEYSKTLVSIGRIDGILRESSEYDVNDKVVSLSGDIIFDDVSFKYDGDQRMILKHIDLTIKQGQTLAVLGPTGSGKTTLMHLLTRFYDVTDGKITIGGTNIGSVDKHTIRKHVAIVLQEPFLFAKSLKDNIKISVPKLGDHLVEEAAKISDIHDNIIGFDKGYDTLVGEKGVSLSGGQKQRIAIARKLITDASVLVFDDSLSAVDTETDARIRQRLKLNKGNLTTIIISHRIASLSEADHIIVIEDGKITESGNHASLVANKGHYYDIWKIQGCQVR